MNSDETETINYFLDLEVKCLNLIKIQSDDNFMSSYFDKIMEEFNILMLVIGLGI